MSPDELTLRAECDVDEGLLLKEGVEDGEEGGAVVVPLQAELLVTRHLNNHAVPIHKIILRSETKKVLKKKKITVEVFFRKKVVKGHSKKSRRVFFEFLRV